MSELLLDEDTFLLNHNAEIIDIVEGCLLDNELYSCDTGLVVLTEEYVNCWTSRHKTHYAPFEDANAIEEITNLWEMIKKGA